MHVEEHFPLSYYLEPHNDPGRQVGRAAQGRVGLVGIRELPYVTQRGFALEPQAQTGFPTAPWPHSHLHPALPVPSWPHLAKHRVTIADPELAHSSCSLPLYWVLEPFSGAG